MSINTGTCVSRTVVAGFLLSFVGAKGCWGLGGNVSLGDDEGGTGGQANSAQSGSAGKVSNATGTAGSGMGSAGSAVGTNGGAGANGGDGGSTGAAGSGAIDISLTVSESGRVSNTQFEISGSLYSASDGVSADGTNPSGGDCELAGHTPAECATVTTPVYSAPGVIDWSVGGLICTKGTAELVVGRPSMPEMDDFASMWGSAIGFNFRTQNAQPAPYNAVAAGIVGIAFDIDAVPLTGLRVEFRTAEVSNEPATWQSSTPGEDYLLSPVQPGHNEVLFRDVKPLPIYDIQTALDPTQLLSVQFHVPTTNTLAEPYSYCISNLSIIVGQ